MVVVVAPKVSVVNSALHSIQTRHPIPLKSNKKNSKGKHLKSRHSNRKPLPRLSNRDKLKLKLNNNKKPKQKLKRNLNKPLSLPSKNRSNNGITRID